MTHIEIADYDPHWPAMFEGEKARILGVIGEWLAAIEHIGSTAVPGLPAKPVIDIMPGLRALDDARHCIAPLQALGYRYVPEYEDEMPFRRYFRKQDATGMRTHHIHMVETTSGFWRRQLIFRDWLRTHPEDSRAYGELKRTLANEFNVAGLSDVNFGYTDRKTEFVRSIEAKAGLTDVEGA